MKKTTSKELPACGIKGHTRGGYDGEKFWCVECTAAAEASREPSEAARYREALEDVKRGLEYLQAGKGHFNLAKSQVAASLSLDIDAVLRGDEPERSWAQSGPPVYRT